MSSAAPDPIRHAQVLRAMHGRKQARIYAMSNRDYGDTPNRIYWQQVLLALDDEQQQEEA